MFAYSLYWRSIAFGLLCVIASSAVAEIDNLVVLVDSETATGGNAIAAFGYNPTDNSMFVSGFGAGGQMRKISGIDATPSAEVYVTETELQLYYRDGDPDRGVLTPLQSAIQLNPQAITSGSTTIPAYSFAVINDNGRTRVAGGSATDSAATKRFYQYNLEAVDFLQGEDGRDVYTTLATLEDMQIAANTTSQSSNQGRQGAWSGDGQSLYFADSSTNFGGIWKLDPISGDVTQLLIGDRDTNIEPAVRSIDGVDTIYISGASEVNDGGIDTFTYDGTTVGARTTTVSAATLQDFLELTGDDVADIRSMTSDTSGNIYFNSTDSSPDRRGIFRLDTEGRLSKVVSYAERDLAFTSDGLGGEDPNSNTLRMQTRTIEHPTAGTITQIMYAESSPLNLVAGVNAFEPGDFDRNGTLDSTDLSAFSDALTIRGQQIVDEDDYRYDLNGNLAVDWKDVKVLQQFADIPTGDTNFDGSLDFDDLDTLDQYYHTNGGVGAETWLAGDIASFVAGYPADAFDANIVNFADLTSFADSWIHLLGQTIDESDLTSRYTGQFLSDALIAFGFESSTLLGDYNGDGEVDLADYTVWRDSLGTTGSQLAADGYADGVVDLKDYQLWKTMFGSTSLSPESVTAVPEPASMVWLVALFAGLGVRRIASSIQS
ncbi:hypothetical protein [Aeoliella mucimassa]|uniref:PEP-CTERM protein-sorting domain-containing protein n=1 Tax=Aeoliella mucimassa TaxID=2527972 RepID=A0A518ARG6_9BACT|nr:hypothetical protein [Aeoliella mucimassa]QDU57306.1 hypothetical protein Pan181_35210 [Aeoliella mucimassa]